MWPAWPGYTTRLLSRKCVQTLTICSTSMSETLSTITVEVSFLKTYTYLREIGQSDIDMVSVSVSSVSVYSCQAQGPTQGPTQGQGQDMVWSWSGQVRSGQTLTPTLTQMWDLSYTLKLVSTTTHHPPPPSLNECLVNFVTLCDTL